MRIFPSTVKGAFSRKSIAESVRAVGDFVMERKLRDAEIVQKVKFARFRDAVVIPIYPEMQLRPNRVAGVDYSVAVATVLRLIVNCQSLVAVCAS